MIIKIDCYYFIVILLNLNFIIAIFCSIINLKFKSMIVKNIPDYHLLTQTHLSPNPNSKPYFLQGLEYSKNILLKLKKQKL
jgi:hypothetical protein